MWILQNPLVGKEKKVESTPDHFKRRKWGQRKASATQDKRNGNVVTE